MSVFTESSGQKAVGGQARRAGRLGLTLVELLVAIAIIGILATLLLGVAAQAGQTAREARSRSIVSRLHTLVVERMEEYREVRAELNRVDGDGNGSDDWLDQLAAEDPTQRYAQLERQQREALGRLFATRERMRMEMPDRWSDVACGPVPDPNQFGAPAPAGLPNPPLVPATAGGQYIVCPRYSIDRPPLNLLYYRQLLSLNRVNTITGQPNTLPEILTNESAECLYLTVMNATADGEARGLFKETDSGDTDGDGALEFLDAWGQPIGWIRWPAGYESDLQLSFTRLVDAFGNPPQGQTGNELVEELLADNHDPLDLFRVDRIDVDSGTPAYASDTGQNGRGWKLTPLIYSAGLDGELGMWTGLQLGGSLPFQTVNANSDPYLGDPAGSRTQLPLGTVFDPETATDNITNHVIEAR